ncbi:hypothetical protein EKO04_000273 [Ascochyta lentis]|uniref:U4/U6.U5 small nuclear ribonucleoprotein 27kDa protein domain-containing protein n=1 Tax=Ascochyta lentis TaxID=205686 RepID=A0A8H7MM63_9PLEO|nr:hypothetical protein EKO04_000273 [Ascochyta lentis]
MSDTERPRDQAHNRDSRREPRGGRDHDNERGNTGSERRNRSRSPRQERGGRRDGGRYRSRSPFRRDEGGRGGRGRGDRNDRGRNDDRGPPKGPRGGPGPRQPPSNTSRPLPKAIKPDPFEDDEPKDVVMKEERIKPEGMDDETWEMAQVMGFAGFKSTKNTKVPGNDKNFGIRRDKQMEARQYMNRQGGFNRPLSPGRG